MDVVFEDNHCLVVVKPAGVLSVGDETGDRSLLDDAKDYLKRKYHKPGEVFLGVVHRLDRPVSGLMLFARTSKAAARLSAQFRERSLCKKYRAWVEGIPNPPSATLIDWLKKDPTTNITRVVPKNSPGGHEASLDFRVIRTQRGLSEVEIELHTGRSHQIRVQLSSRGWPIVSDVKYGAAQRWPGKIALHAGELIFDHPVRHEPIPLTTPPPHFWRDITG